MTETTGYRALWVERNYLRSFAAGVINRFGDSIDALAFAWMVYELTGARAWSALLFGLNTLPTVLLMPFAGVLVERMDQRRVMILADVGRAVLVSAVAVLYALGRAEAWMLACSTLLMSSLEAFRIPAGMGIYPRIVPREKYAAAMSLSQTVGGIAVILGSGAFGPVTAALGLQGAMAVNAATFALSALLISRIRLPRVERPAGAPGFAPFFRNLREGFTYFYSRRLIFCICLMGGGIGMLFVPLSSLLAPYVQESLGQGEVALGLIQTAAMVGATAGTALFPLLSRRAGRLRLLVSGGVLCAGGYLVAAAVSRLAGAWLGVGLLAGYMLLFGAGQAMLSVVVNLVFMEQVETAYLVRVGSLFNALANGLGPLASFLTAAVAVAVRAEGIFLVCGILALGLFLWAGRSTLLREIG